MIIQFINTYKGSGTITHQHNQVFCLIYKEDNLVDSHTNEQIEIASSKFSEGQPYLIKATKDTDTQKRLDIRSTPSRFIFERAFLTNKRNNCNNSTFYINFTKGTYFAPIRTKSITTYTTPNYTYYQSLKDFPENHHINFKEIDISEKPILFEKPARQTEQQGVPQTNINGTFVFGFNQSKQNKLLEINKQ